MKTEFDSHARSYNQVLQRAINFSGERSDYFNEYKIKDLHYEILKRGLDPNASLRILDFGCGTGNSLQYARKKFSNATLIGADISEESLNIARDRDVNDVSFFKLQEGGLPSPIRDLHIVYSMCVFHHIQPSSHLNILAALRDKMKQEGLLFIYEHNPLNPLTLRVVNSCPFDVNAILIPANVLAKRCREAGFSNVKVAYRVFFPRFLNAIRGGERVLSRLPLGAQYYVSCTA